MARAQRRNADRSFQGLGEPARVIALPSACERLGPNPRRALGPAAIPPHQQAGHVTAPDQCCSNVRKFLPWRRHTAAPRSGVKSPSAHSSGGPALRRPSNRVGMSAACSLCHLRVRLGLMRRASTKADFASSILPSSAYAAARPAYTPGTTITGVEYLLVFVDRSFATRPTATERTLLSSRHHS